MGLISAAATRSRLCGAPPVKKDSGRGLAPVGTCPAGSAGATFSTGGGGRGGARSPLPSAALAAAVCTATTGRAAPVPRAARGGRHDVGHVARPVLVLAPAPRRGGRVMRAVVNCSDLDARGQGGCRTISPRTRSVTTPDSRHRFVFAGAGGGARLGRWLPYIPTSPGRPLRSAVQVTQDRFADDRPSTVGGDAATHPVIAFRTAELTPGGFHSSQQASAGNLPGLRRVHRGAPFPAGRRGGRCSIRVVHREQLHDAGIGRPVHWAGMTDSIACDAWRTDRSLRLRTGLLSRRGGREGRIVDGNDGGFVLQPKEEAQRLLCQTG